MKERLRPEETRRLVDEAMERVEKKAREHGLKTTGTPRRTGND